MNLNQQLQEQMVEACIAATQVTSLEAAKATLDRYFQGRSELVSDESLVSEETVEMENSLKSAIHPSATPMKVFGVITSLANDRLPEPPSIEDLMTGSIPESVKSMQGGSNILQGAFGRRFS